MSTVYPTEDVNSAPQSVAVPETVAVPADLPVDNRIVAEDETKVKQQGGDNVASVIAPDDERKVKQQVGDNVASADAPDQQEAEKSSFVQGLKDKVEDKFPKDRALRMLFYTSFIFILAGIVLLIFAIIWISITRGTTFGAYSVLLFIAAIIMSGISLINIFVLCRNPNQVFCHAVMAIITFFVFIALLILAIILGGFHILTINFEYAIFKMDFEYFQDKLALDTEKKIKAVDGGYFYLALILGIVTALIIVAMFILSTIVCCQYVQCNYFLPFLCGLMPFMVGAFGIIFAISLGSVGAMTRSRYSFIYNPQGWIIFFMGLVDLFLSFILLGCFFGCTCKSDRNEIMKDATYPEEGYSGDHSRSDVLGFDYWNCKHEFCILLWLNVLVCTPVFVVILVVVVINGGPNHDVPLPCFYPNQLIHCDEAPSASLLLSASSFASLSSFNDSRLPSHLRKQTLSNQDTCQMLPTTCIDYTPKPNPNLEWENFAGQCEEFRNSAAKYSLGMGIVSLNQYSSSRSFSTRTIKTLSTSRTLLSRTTMWVRSLLPHTDTDKPASEAMGEPVPVPVTSSSSPSSSSSFAPLSLSLVNTVLAMNSKEQQQLEGQEGEAEAEAEAEEVFEYEGTEYGYRQEDNGATVVVRRRNSGNNGNSGSGMANGVSRGVYNGSAVVPAEATSNGIVCHDYSSVVKQWQEDIETFGADMCRITGFAMLVPAAPILALDAVIFGIAMAVATVVTAWLWILCAYYICHCIMACCCQEHVTDRVEVHGNTITEYYHIEDHSPDFNCCICCGIVGCCQFICLFSACVLEFCLKDDWCGLSCNKADRRKPKTAESESGPTPGQQTAAETQQQPAPTPEQLAYMQQQQQLQQQLQQQQQQQPPPQQPQPGQYAPEQGPYGQPYGYGQPGQYGQPQYAQPQSQYGQAPQQLPYQPTPDGGQVQYGEPPRLMAYQQTPDGGQPPYPQAPGQVPYPQQGPYPQAPYPQGPGGFPPGQGQGYPSYNGGAPPAPQ